MEENDQQTGPVLLHPSLHFVCLGELSFQTNEGYTLAMYRHFEKYLIGASINNQVQFVNLQQLVIIWLSLASGTA